MENDKKHPEEKTIEHADMPIKTTGTDNTKNTSTDEGLNKTKTANPSLEPGTTSDPDFTETD